MAYGRSAAFLALCLAGVTKPASAQMVEGWGTGITLANPGSLTLDVSNYLTQGGHHYQISTAYLYAYAYSHPAAQFVCQCYLDLGTTQDTTYTPGSLTFTTTHTISVIEYADGSESFTAKLGGQTFAAATPAQGYLFDWLQPSDSTSLLFIDPDGLFGNDGPMNVYSRSITRYVASVGGNWGWTSDSAFLDAANLASINSTGHLTLDYTASYSPGWSPGFDATFARLYFSLTQLPDSVPEPSSWAMLVAGFGLIGAAMRSGRVRLQGAR